jgi:hypothetical protein
MLNIQNNFRIPTPQEKENYDFNPLREVIFEEYPEVLAQKLHEVLYMLTTVDRKFFTQNEVISRYYTLRQLRDAILKGGKLCQ